VAAKRTTKKSSKRATSSGRAAPPQEGALGDDLASKLEKLPPNVVTRRTAEIDPKDPLASGAKAPLRQIWQAAARDARDNKKVVIDIIGEGRGIIAIPVVFDSEDEAMNVMTPALDFLVTHCSQAGRKGERPVMVDLQELRERLKLQPEEDWVSEHSWLDNALAKRELLCMYVFSPSYLLEFSVAIGEKQGFRLDISKQDPGFYELTPKEGEGLIVWNWARAIADVISGGHSWSYFGLLLALAPQVAQQKKKADAANPPAPKTKDEE
jgi:hypothetical protein